MPYAGSFVLLKFCMLVCENPMRPEFSQMPRSLHKSLPPLAPPDPAAQARWLTLPASFPGEILLLGAALLILGLG